MEGEGSGRGVQERYLRWMLGVSRMTPRYMIREKLQREKLRTRAGRRAWRMEERLAGDRGSELVRKCWKEVRERARKGGGRLSGWERERQSFFEDRNRDGRWKERGKKSC